MSTDNYSHAPAPDQRYTRRVEAIVLAVIFILVNIASALWQKPISYQEGRGWEGVVYSSVAEQFAEHRLPVEADAPEVYRVGTPFLAGTAHRWTGWDLFACFKLVNGVANALTLALLVLWLRRFIADWTVRAALAVASALQWDTPARWMYFFPVHTDPWMWVFLFAGLLAVERYREQSTPTRLAVVTLLTALGVCFREVVLVIACIVPFVKNPLPTANFRAVLIASRWSTVRRQIFRLVVPEVFPLVVGLLVMTAIRHLVARQDNAYSFALTAIHSIYEKPWPTYLHGWFLAFGPILWLAIFQARKAGAFLAARQHLAVYLLAFTLLGYIGGTDTERLLYWSMPVVYVIIGQGFMERRRSLPGWLLAVLAGAQALAGRAVFWPIPDYPSDAPHVWPLFTPLGRHVPFLDLYGFWEPRLLAVTSLLTYLAFGAVLAAWFVFHGARLPEETRIRVDAR